MPIVSSRLSLIVALLAAAACSSKDAPDKAASDVTTSADIAAGAEPTANEISNYALDMDKMRKYSGAIKGFASLSSRDSVALDAMSSGSGNESTAQMIAKIESSPVATRILRENGLSAKDFVWITAAWLQAAMTQGMMETNAQAKMPEGQNPRNVEFLNANKSELEKIMKDAGMTQ